MTTPYRIVESNSRCGSTVMESPPTVMKSESKLNFRLTRNFLRMVNPRPECYDRFAVNGNKVAT